MAKKTYILELTQRELELIRDGIDCLSPDNQAGKKLQAELLRKIESTKPAKPSEIVISVSGGVVTDVLSTDKTADVTVLDYDSDHAGAYKALWENEISPRVHVDLFTVW